MRVHALLTRLLLPVAAMTLLATETKPAPASPTRPLRLGQMEVWRVQDGRLSLEASLLTGIPLEETKRLLGGKDAAATPVNAFLVRIQGKTILVDAGAGKAPDEDTGHLAEQLSAAGVAPSAIDLIVITHFHFDHIGGLVKPDGTRAFPRARLLVPKREYAFWLEKPSMLPERLRDRAPKLKALFDTYEQAGAFHAFEDGEPLAPGLRAIPAEGHTGGHTIYAFTSEGQELWCIGDLIHFGAVQFQHPEAGVSFDLDAKRAIQIRQDLFRQAAKAKALLAGAHLPGLLRIESKGAEFQQVPIPLP